MNSKTLVWVYLFVLSVGTIFSLWVPKNEAVAKDSIVIPGDAIRLRILANSDTGADQALKEKVRDAVNAQIELWVQDLTSKDKAKQVIKENLPKIEAIAEKVVHDEGSSQSVKVQFGKVQFPTKLYGQFLYPAGEYQAVLITLGKGLGANWWCVLFPPLCFLDFSNGVAVSNGFDEQKSAAKTASSDQASYGAKDAAAKDSDHSEDQQSGDHSSADLQSGNDANTGEQSSVTTQDSHSTGESSSVTTQDGNDASAGESSSVTTQEGNHSSAGDQSATLPQSGNNTLAGSDSAATSQSGTSAGDTRETPQDAVTANDSSVTSQEDPDQADGSLAAQADATPQQVSGDQSGSGLSSDQSTKQKAAPVYTSEDEQPVQVKFFVVELWHKLFG